MSKKATKQRRKTERRKAKQVRVPNPKPMIGQLNHGMSLAAVAALGLAGMKRASPARTDGEQDE